MTAHARDELDSGQQRLAVAAGRELEEARDQVSGRSLQREA